jgi:hypothetical protein
VGKASFPSPIVPIQPIVPVQTAIISQPGLGIKIIFSHFKFKFSVKSYNINILVVASPVCDIRANSFYNHCSALSTCQLCSSSIHCGTYIVPPGKLK